MNKFQKDGVVKIKNHIGRNKVAYAMGAVAILAIALQQSNVNAFRKFLAEKGINEMEYFNPEMFAEINS